ncbi:sialidase family protein [Streptomyces sp. A012304]|uniref:sialidase family protein n=1 Tax=Streptomyces sp. A012304 TaxID=375446 RepID=UPI002231E413|nr:hypothetical protein [Streptomyces sp. A012304]GKQ36655.1 hypothetical protein ALMP_31950 [Streptomyces sp. A012304]
MRLIPDDPFPEVGHPFTTVVSADGRWLAVACSVTGRNGGGRVAVYRTSDLALWDQFVLERGIEDMAFHPALPVLAVGTEDGDEFERRGGLHLYEPGTRRRADAALPDVGVTGLRWLDARRLEVTFAAPVVDYEDLGRDAYTRRVVERDDWATAAGPDTDASAALEALVAGERVPVDIDRERPGAADLTRPQRYLAELAAERGRTWTRRAGVAVVHALRDGRVLTAAQGGTLLECWSPDGGELWSVPAPEDAFQRSGCRLYVTPDERTVWITVLVGTSDNRTTLLRRFALADGTLLAELKFAFPVALASRTDGVWIARDSRELYPGPRWPPYESVVLTPSGKRLGALALGESDNSYDLQVRRSPHLLLLQGAGAEDTRTELLEKWVVRVAPDGAERLFPYAWGDAAVGPVGRFLRGGPAVYVEDDGAGLVHACTDGLDGFLLRRALPGGEVVWAHRLPARVTGVDAHAGLVHAVTAAGPDNGELLTLRADDGEILRRVPTAVGGHVFTPTCLSVSDSGALVIGTVEGRVLSTRV